MTATLQESHQVRLACSYKHALYHTASLCITESQPATVIHTQYIRLMHVKKSTSDWISMHITQLPEYTLERKKTEVFSSEGSVHCLQD